MRISIKQIPFTLREPYKPGDVIGVAEARKLNVERGENIRKNLLRLGFMKEMEEIPTGEEWMRLKRFVEVYDTAYKLPEEERRGGRQLTGLEEELYAVAAERTRVLGVRTKKAFETAVAAEMQTVECFEEARRRWLVKSKSARRNLEELLA